MRKLIPCPECSRHVLVSEQACPFCRSTRVGVHLSMVVVAFSLAGCRGSTQDTEQRRPEPVPSSAPTAARSAATGREGGDPSRDIEALQRELEIQRTQAAVYGAPPPPKTTRDGGQSACNCAPGDPLCSCQ